MVTIGCAEYCTSLYDPKSLAKIVKRAAITIKAAQRKYKFDALAFRGSSGSAVAYPLSVLTGIPLIFVRKAKEMQHGCDVEGPNKSISKYAIVDDFISTGDTIHAINKAIKRTIKTGGVWGRGPKDDGKIECVAIILYDSGKRRDFFLEKKAVPVITVPKR